MKKNLLFILALGLTTAVHGKYLSKTGLKENCFSIDVGEEGKPKPFYSPYRKLPHNALITAIFSGIMWNSLTLLTRP